MSAHPRCQALAPQPFKGGGPLLSRRALLLLAAMPSGAIASAVRPDRVLSFPRDHGAHPDTRTEWWYVTGWRGPMAAPTQGFQLTFFRSATGLAADSRSRFAPRQLLFAHAAITDLAARTHRHAERLVRWNGDPAAQPAAAALHDAAVHIGDWHLTRDDAGWTLAAADPASGVDLAMRLRRTQPLLLQGDGGYSRKGPEPGQASHYLSEPQLAVAAPAGGGHAWLDHEWSDELLHPAAVGWDWAGINLADGAALTVFRLRRADGGVLWAGGSWRPADGPLRSFQPHEVNMHALRHWRSPATAASYPVDWTLETPAGTFRLQALLDAQELDARRSTGTVYWEGLSALLDAQGRRIGLGYLELTGYAGRLRL